MGLEEKIPSGFVLTTVEKLAGYMRKNSLWPATFGLACCAIEMMAVGSAAKYDIARFGGEVFRASPRQADQCLRQSGFLQWVHVHLQVECSTTTRLFRA
ncbi:MAG: hypothetical protein RL568_670 [Actinomycetota bacterium]